MHGFLHSIECAKPMQFEPAERARADGGELVGDGKSFLESLLFLIYAAWVPMPIHDCPHTG